MRTHHHLYTQENARLVKPSEHNEQAAFMNWLLTFKLNQYPEIHPLWFSVPNGAHLAGGQKQRAMQMNTLKREGFTPGVADTLFLAGRGGYFGLAMEFKTEERRIEKNGGLSENQLEFLRSLRQQGYQAVVAYGADEAQVMAENYLAMPPTQALIWTALRYATQGNLEKCKETLERLVAAW